MVKERSRFKLNYLLFGIVVVILIVAAMELLSQEPEVITHFTLQEVLEQVKGQGPIIFAHPTGASLAGGNEVATAMAEQLDQWQLMENVPKEIPEGGFVLYLDLLTDLSLHFYPGKPEFAMIKQGEFNQYYTLPEGIFQTFEMMHMVKSYHIPESVVEALVGGEKTSEMSVQDVPNVPYKRLSIGRDTYYLYERDGKYYIEAPYQFIKQLSQAVYEGALPYTDPDGPVDNNTDSISLVPFTEKVDDSYKRVGSLYGGDKVLFKPSGFYNKLEKGEHILLETGSGLYTLVQGMPGKPVISSNGKLIAYVDVLEFEAKGDVYIYNAETDTLNQVTHYVDANPPVSITAKDVLWLDNNHLLIIAGFDVGTVTQGGDVYLYSLKDLSLKAVFKAEESEEVANMEWVGDQILMEIVYWTDANFNDYLYREQLLTPETLLVGLE